jgi:hypothetical protein
MVRGPKRHDGEGWGGACHTFHSGDICIKGSSGDGCTPMSKSEALQLALDLIVLVKEMEDTANTSTSE